MHELGFLRDLVVLIAVAIPVVALAQRLRVPSVAGFLLTGVVIGPGVFGLVGRPEDVAALAELGVVLLLFTIGLELSISRVFRMGKAVVWGGSMQVIGTLAVVAGVAFAAGLAWRPAVFFGALAALSSTAIVLRVLQERKELDTPHGRVMVAVLLFQDLCVVPLMLLAPILAGTEGGWKEAVTRVAMGFSVVGALVLAGRYVVPPFLSRVVGLRNRELFTFCMLLFGLGSAWLTARFGLSLALGAFIAGLVVSESEYGLQMLSDVLPFRDASSGIFFIAVGMLLDPRFVLERPLVVLATAAGLIAIKALIAGGATILLGRSLKTAILSGLGLAQIGEFAFVLAVVGIPLGLLDPATNQIFVSTSALTMIVTPLLILASRGIAQKIARLAGRARLGSGEEESEGAIVLHDHVVIVGYGVNGRNLARVLRVAAIPYVILEQSGQLVRLARREGEPIHFGDGASREVLHKVGLERARALVLAISSPHDERRAVAVARDMSPSIRIIARTRWVSEIGELMRLGADEVIPEEFETSLEIFARVLRLYGTPQETIAREVEAARGEHYEMLRGLSLYDLKAGEVAPLTIRDAVVTVVVEEGSPAVGNSAVSLRLRETTGATVITVIRRGRSYPNPPPDFTFDAGDSVVLLGDAESQERGGAVFRAKIEIHG
jgi:CPA2 family monovalent cation:H+ antiporter-2